MVSVSFGLSEEAIFVSALISQNFVGHALLNGSQVVYNCRQRSSCKVCIFRLLLELASYHARDRARTQSLLTKPRFKTCRAQYETCCTPESSSLAFEHANFCRRSCFTSLPVSHSCSSSDALDTDSMIGFLDSGRLICPSCYPLLGSTGCGQIRVTP